MIRFTNCIFGIYICGLFFCFVFLEKFANLFPIVNLLQILVCCCTRCRRLITCNHRIWYRASALIEDIIQLTGKFIFKICCILCIFRTTFLVAEACLIAGATKNAYHTKYRGMIYAQNFSCEALRKGVFISGAVFVVVTMILNVYYYMYFTKATTTQAAHKANHSSSTVGMAGYA